MKQMFAASEIVEIGIEIEKNGKDFYSSLAKRSKDRGAKEVFQYLAKEEEKHITAFKKILIEADKKGPGEVASEDYFSYMNALAQECVFNQKDKGRLLAGKVASDEEAVSLGIGFEKESIVFYEGMKQAVTESSRAVLDELISQEQDHLRRLYAFREKLK